MVKILAVSFSSSHEEWCLRSDPGVVEREYIFKKRECRKPYNKPLFDLVRNSNPEVFIFATQNEAKSSDLHANVAAGLETLGYKLFKQRVTKRNVLSRISVATSIFIPIANPPMIKLISAEKYNIFDDNFEFFDDSVGGRVAVSQGISFTITEDNEEFDYLLVNTYLPPPLNRSGMYSTSGSYALYRHETIAANARFLERVKNEILSSPTTKRDLIFLGDFDTEARADTKVRGYDSSIDEMVILKDLILSDLNLKEGDISFPPTSMYKVKSKVCIPGTDSSCYVASDSTYEDTPGRLPGWRDRILFSAGIRELEYNTLLDRDSLSTEHLPVYALLDVSKMKYQPSATPRSPVRKRRGGGGRF